MQNKLFDKTLLVSFSGSFSSHRFSNIFRSLPESSGYHYFQAIALLLMLYELAYSCLENCFQMCSLSYCLVTGDSCTISSKSSIKKSVFVYSTSYINCIWRVTDFVYPVYFSKSYLQFLTCNLKVGLLYFILI